MPSLDPIADLDPAMCPYCSNDDESLIEPKGHEWLCLVCSRTWRKMCEASDRRFLKSMRISPPKA